MKRLYFISLESHSQKRLGWSESQESKLFFTAPKWKTGSEDQFWYIFAFACLLLMLSWIHIWSLSIAGYCNNWRGIWQICLLLHSSQWPLDLKINLTLHRSVHLDMDLKRREQVLYLFKQQMKLHWTYLVLDNSN